MAQEGIEIESLNRHDLGETLFEKLKEKYELKEALLGSTTMRYHERMVMLSVMDGLWKDHLLSMDHLKEGIGLRGYGQQDPLVAYKKESFDMFEAMMTRFQEDTVRFLFLMQIVGPDGRPITQLPRRQDPEISTELVAPVAPPALPAPVQPVGNGAHAAPSRPPVVPVPMRAPSTTIDALEMEFQRKKKKELEQARMAGANGSSDSPAQRRTGDKVGRNDLCPCGSGKKYKKCHGVES